MTKTAEVPKVRQQATKSKMGRTDKTSVRGYNRPYVMGIRSQISNDVPVTVEQKLRLTGNNTGNLMFSESLFRQIRGAIPGCYDFNDEDIAEADCIVIAAANWLSPHSRFGALAERLEKTNLPIVIVGVGAQSTMDMKVPTVEAGTVRLMKVISERCHSLSVRGTFSAEVLNSIGVKNVTVTGCPSLLLCGSGGPKIRHKPRITDEECIIHSTRHLFHPAEQLQRYLYQQAFRRDITLLLQSELAEMYFTLRRTNNVSIVERADSVFKLTYEISDLRTLHKYLENNSVVFFSVDEWFEFLKKKQFCVGSRIHGTVASILAGTPALLIAHDSRTLEMAEAMNIPCVPSSRIDVTKDIPIERYYELAQSWNFEAKFADYYRTFSTFFEKNGLKLN